MRSLFIIFGIDFFIILSEATINKMVNNLMKLNELAMKKLFLVALTALVGLQLSAQNVSVSKALVRVSDDCCSPQTIVTRCTLYQQYTTKEALHAAAKSYGGLTDGDFFLNS